MVGRCDVRSLSARPHPASGARSGVNGTPTFFINGARFDGRWDEAGLIAAVSAH